MKNRKKGSAWWKILLGIPAVFLILFGLYAAYVFGTYSRIEDNLVLTANGQAQEAAKTGEEYTIVSYNIGFGAYTPDFTFFMDGGKESRARSVESVLACVEGASDTALSYSPDFALFQEVDTDSDRSFHVQQADLINGKFGLAGDYANVFAQNYHSAYLLYPPLEPHGASNSGLLTLSSRHIDDALRRSLPIAENFRKILDLDRCYSIQRIPVDDGKELILINLHLSAYGTDDSLTSAQLKKIFEDMKKEYASGNYVICGGDFNHDFTGDSRAYFNPFTDKDFDWCHAFPDDLIPAHFSKCTDYADGLIPSARNADIPYSEKNFTVILDGFIVSDNIDCTYVQNMDTGFLYSDHNPVVMKFILREEN